MTQQRILTREPLYRQVTARKWYPGGHQLPPNISPHRGVRPERSGGNNTVRPSPGFTPLHLAVWRGYYDIVLLLLERPRIEVNKVDDIRSTISGGTTYGTSSQIPRPSPRDRSVDVKVPSGRGWAPLHGAVVRKDYRILRILLGDERIDVNILTIGGETPLWLGVRHDSVSAVRLLLAHPKTHISLATGSILHFAIPCAVRPVIEVLLEDKRIDVNSLDRNRRTALHIAASLGMMDAIQSLLGRKDIDVGMLDGQGREARDLALPRFPEVAKCLTVKQILENNGIEYLDLAIGIGNERKKAG
ncbi:ankyrin repeat-containing domain protein [Tuber indicum]|nr:ankyrin repeat-containing domain protein [Tuber indicum]